MDYNILDIGDNPCLWAGIISWAIAQFTKIILVFIKEKRFDATRIVGSGGMPSSHSSLVMALTISIGKYNGFHSPLFAVSLIMSLVVMYDAAGVRRAAGKQAAIINSLLIERSDEKKEKLKELLGHTPLEVFAGAFLGIIVGSIY